MKTLKRLFQYPLLLAFCGFILFFSLWDMTVSNRTFSDFENRYLTKRPDFSWKSLLNNTFTPKYEEYINDQFVMRDEWIALKAVGESLLGKTENNGIVYGADGYLFEKYKKVPDEQLKKNMGFVQRFLQAYPQLSITLAVVPNSYTILPEKVPYGLGNVDQRQAIGEIYRLLEGAQVRPLDLYGPLDAHADEEIFYHTDHHWTTRGAYYAYAAYVEQLGLVPVSLDEMTPIRVEDFYGTNFSKAKNPSIRPDTILYYDIPVTETIIDGVAADGYYDMQKWGERDKYAAFLRGNNGLTILRSAVNRDHTEGETSKVLVIKDSYANSMVPFLLYNFDEVHVVDLRSNTTMVSEILAEHEYQDILLLYNFMNFASDTNLYRLSY